MDVQSISPAGISQAKQAELQSKAEVQVLKKKLDSEGSVEQKLITEAATSLPPGVGGKLNKIA
jgi:Ethanolamine utilization protein EutJ (predicted chaperonin)